MISQDIWLLVVEKLYPPHINNLSQTNNNLNKIININGYNHLSNYSKLKYFQIYSLTNKLIKSFFNQYNICIYDLEVTFNSLTYEYYPDVWNSLDKIINFKSTSDYIIIQFMNIYSLIINYFEIIKHLIDSPFIILYSYYNQGYKFKRTTDISKTINILKNLYSLKYEFMSFYEKVKDNFPFLND